MAEAIASYRFDQKWLPANATHEYISIIMQGLTSTFYKISISLKLVNNVGKVHFGSV